MRQAGVLSTLVGSLALLAALCAQVPAGAGAPQEDQTEELQFLREEHYRRLDYADSDMARFYALAKVAKLRCEEGDYELAEQHAIELLTLAKSFPDDWNYGNALHDGNMVLGRVALARGNRAEAKRRLLQAGRTPGSPQLDTFGPNMSLADDLLRVGESDVVIDYFALCRKFWKHGTDELAQWTEAVRQGGHPTFGNNLVF